MQEAIVSQPQAVRRKTRRTPKQRQTMPSPQLETWVNYFGAPIWN
jgi:hypothetical protein